LEPVPPSRVTGLVVALQATCAQALTSAVAVHRATVAAGACTVVPAVRVPSAYVTLSRLTERVVDLALVIVALRTDIAGARATSPIVAVRLHSAIVRS
jgi:hypothetical protein